jgi:energy-converting hydrogenase Eha subunit A
MGSYYDWRAYLVRCHDTISFKLRRISLLKMMLYVRSLFGCDPIMTDEPMCFWRMGTFVIIRFHLNWGVYLCRCIRSFIYALSLGCDPIMTEKPLGFLLSFSFKLSRIFTLPLEETFALNTKIYSVFGCDPIMTDEPTCWWWACCHNTISFEAYIRAYCHTFPSLVRLTGITPWHIQAYKWSSLFQFWFTLINSRLLRCYLPFLAFVLLW